MSSPSFWYLQGLSYTPQECSRLIQSIRHALAQVDGSITQELVKVRSIDFRVVIVVTYVRFVFSTSLVNFLQFALPHLKNCFRTSLDLTGFRFDCERRLCLSWWHPCLSIQLTLTRNISTPCQGQEEFTVEETNSFWHSSAWTDDRWGLETYFFPSSWYSLAHKFWKAFQCQY